MRRIFSGCCALSWKRKSQEHRAKSSPSDFFRHQFLSCFFLSLWERIEVRATGDNDRWSLTCILTRNEGSTFDSALERQAHGRPLHSRPPVASRLLLTLPAPLIHQFAVLMGKALAALRHRQLRASTNPMPRTSGPGNRWIASAGAVSVAIGTRGEKVTTQILESRTSSAT